MRRQSIVFSTKVTLPKLWMSISSSTAAVSVLKLAQWEASWASEKVRYDMHPLELSRGSWFLRLHQWLQYSADAANHSVYPAITFSNVSLSISPCTS